MAQSKKGVKGRKPSHLRYNAKNQRFHNKLARVIKFCGSEFAAAWEKKYA